MASLRRHIGHHPTLAALILAAALLLRVLVPAGFMPDVSSGRIAISLCTGFGPTRMAMAMPGSKSGTPGESAHGKGAHGKADMPCGFAGLSAPGLTGADPLQLALALVFIVATAPFATRILVVRRVPRLRPPLRGPPVTV